MFQIQFILGALAAIGCTWTMAGDPSLLAAAEEMRVEVIDGALSVELNAVPLEQW
jgi:hypothetical protein